MSPRKNSSRWLLGALVAVGLLAFWPSPASAATMTPVLVDPDLDFAPRIIAVTFAMICGAFVGHLTKHD